MTLHATTAFTARRPNTPRASKILAVFRDLQSIMYLHRLFEEGTNVYGAVKVLIYRARKFDND